MMLIRDSFPHINPSAEPPKGLREAVFAYLERAQTRRAWQRFALDAAIACLSAVAFVLTAKMFLAEFASSGAFAYLSVTFTNLAFWKESLLSFIEAFPALIAAAPLAAVLVLLFSLQRAFVDGSSAFHHRKFA